MEVINNEELTFEEKVNACKLVVTDHAYKRYAERVKFKASTLSTDDKQKFLVEIKKLFISSELKYVGGIGRNKNAARVYFNKNGWVLLLNQARDELITLYKVDLGIGDDELNQRYVDKSLENIDVCNEHLILISDETLAMKKELDKKIAANDAKVAEYTELINALNKQTSVYKNERSVVDTQLLVAKKEFKSIVDNYCAKDVINDDDIDYK